MSESSDARWWYWTLRQQSIAVDQEIVRAEKETQQLRSVLSKVQNFESRKAQLQQRVSLIEELRKGQSAPVHVLDRISRSLPERLWLTELKQTGPDFALTGYGTSMTALSDFVGNLENTNRFKRPVEIIDSQVQSDKSGQELVRFSIKATFYDPSAPPPPPAATPAAGRGRGGAARGAK